MIDDPQRSWQLFSDAARHYFEAASRNPAAPDAAAYFGDLLREQFASLWEPWRRPPPPNPATVMGDMPAMGATREHQLRAQRVFDATQRMDAAQRRLQRLWSDVLKDAASKFAEHLNSAEPGTASPDTISKLYSIWIECAEDAYGRIAHGEDFCRAQAELANAGSQWRSEQQANVELWLKSLDLPTRSELNTLNHRLRAAEAQLRALRPVAPREPRPQGSQLRRSRKRSKKKT